MADENGNIDVEKLAEFKPTMELRWFECRHNDNVHDAYKGQVYKTSLQQKWINELNEEQWRDIPLVENK